VEPAADLEDCSGISDPLYDCIDCLFQLQTRGFFRRQVFAVARQALSLVAGEAIDAYLTSKLRLLRQQHTIGRIISQIQASLWPGGVWFQYTPGAQAAAASRDRQQAAAAGSYVRPEGMDAARFLEPR
jgi:sorting nexin-13